MTADERDLTPEEEAELSRLLADAGGPVATPPEVVARLDDVLAGLVAERGGQSTDADPAPVVSLEARRRRRWPRALLAAAAVVAGGYGVGTALTGTTMSGDAISADESAAGGSADGSASGSDAGGAGDGRAMESESKRDTSDRAQAPANPSTREAAPRLRSDRLAADVVRLLEDGDQELTGATATVPNRALIGAAAACLPRRLGPEDSWFLVRYDGSRAALVTTPAEEGTVQASVLGCDGERLDSVTVPAP